jgi:fluoroquinolone transport system ATP-binding protein
MSQGPDPIIQSPLVDVRSLQFRYPGATENTLQGLSFSLNPGEIYGFLGPSGAGKSTTQKILYRLLSGYHGSVRIAGREIAEWGQDVYSRMGIVFETPNLYLKLTGRENLEFALSLRRVRHGEKPVPAMKITDAAARLGLGDAIDDRVETYSKGMRMRLSFIRAVLHGPDILFLDEPTSGLDLLWSRQVKNWILDLRQQGTAVFLTTHSMELADELCDTVGFLVEGSLITQESPSRLKQLHGNAGIRVHGLCPDGSPLEREITYGGLLEESAFREFGTVTRVLNLEVSLEQVFLQVTGHSLQTSIPAGDVS